MVGVYNKFLTKMFDTHRSLSFKAARFVRPSRASKFSIPSRSVFSKETSGRTTSYICYGKGRNMGNYNNNNIQLYCNFFHAQKNTLNI